MAEDQSRKTCLITGASSGIGLALAEELAQSGFNVIVGARSASKSQATVDELKKKHPQVADRFMTSADMDLDDAAAIRKSVDELKTPLDALVLNAGVNSDHLVPMKNGCDICFSTKVVGHHILTMELLNQNKLKNGSTILATGSEASRGDILGENIANYAKLGKEKFKGDYTQMAARVIRGDRSLFGFWNTNYSSANLFAELWAYGLAPQLFAHNQIRIMSVSPGAVKSTSITRHFNPIKAAIARFVMGTILGAPSANETVKERHLPMLMNPEKFEIGRFYASKPKKLTGPPVLQNNPSLTDMTMARAVVKAVEAVSETKVPEWLSEGAS